MKIVNTLIWAWLVHEARATMMEQAPAGAAAKELASDTEEFWHRFVQYDGSLSITKQPTPRPTSPPKTPRKLARGSVCGRALIYEI